MSIQGISGGFSANSLIAASRLQARRAAFSVDAAEGVELPVLPSNLVEEVQAPRRIQPVDPIGPGVGELTQRPSGERPFGLFRNEYVKDASKQNRDGQSGVKEEDSQEKTQDLVNQIVGEPESEKDEPKGDLKDGSKNPPAEQDNPKAQPGETRSAETRPVNSDELSEEDLKEVQRLQRRDAEVVAHENAHKAAAGSLSTGAIHYETEKGPDGRSYRTGGHVNINTAKGKTPEETLERAAKIKRAALAPAEPSPQDRAVANKANQMETEARQELAEKRLEEAQDSSEKNRSSIQFSSKASQSTDAAKSDQEVSNSDADVSADSTKKPETENTNIHDFRANKAISGYQNSSNLTNPISSGTFFRLSA